MDMGANKAFLLFHPVAPRGVLQISEGAVQRRISLQAEAFLRRLWCSRQALQFLPLSASEAQLIVSLPTS